MSYILQKIHIKGVDKVMFMLHDLASKQASRQARHNCVLFSGQKYLSVLHRIGVSLGVCFCFFVKGVRNEVIHIQ